MIEIVDVRTTPGAVHFVVKYDVDGEEHKETFSFLVSDLRDRNEEEIKEMIRKCVEQRREQISGELLKKFKGLKIEG